MCILGTLPTRMGIFHFTRGYTIQLFGTFDFTPVSHLAGARSNAPDSMAGGQARLQSLGDFLKISIWWFCIVGAARLRDTSGADATTRRHEHKSQRRSVRRDKGRRDYAKTRLREDANTSRNVAASDATTRRRRPNSQRRSVTASQRQTRQRQTRLCEDANTSRNVAASDATTRRRRPNSQRRSVRRDRGRCDYAKTRTQVATSQRRSVRHDHATTRRRSRKSQRRSVAAPSRSATAPAPTLWFCFYTWWP